MTGSSSHSNLDLQIAARNRWADQRGARPSDVVAAHDAARPATGAGSRGLAAAAAVAVAVAAVVMFFVVALHSSPHPVSTTAPAAPGISASHPTTADAADHAAVAQSSPTAPAGGGGSGHAVAE